MFATVDIGAGLCIIGGGGFGDGGILLTRTIKDDKGDRRWVPPSFQR
jgi:hypothetical protein